MSVERPEGPIEDAGRRGEPRRLDQMISARLDPLLVAALRKLAEARGVSLSDVLRDAALQLLAREEAQNVRTFCVEVTNETRSKAKHESYRQDVPLAVLQFMESAAELGCDVPVIAMPGALLGAFLKHAAGVVAWPDPIWATEIRAILGKHSASPAP